MAKEQSTHLEANTVMFTTEGSAKSWHGRPVKTTNERKGLLDGGDDWDVAEDLPEWDSHPRNIKERAKA